MESFKQGIKQTNYFQTAKLKQMSDNYFKNELFRTTSKFQRAICLNKLQATNFADNLKGKAPEGQYPLLKCELLLLLLKQALVGRSPAALRIHTAAVGESPQGAAPTAVRDTTAGDDMIRVTMLRAISLGRDAEKLRCLSRLAHRGVSRTCLGGLET